MKCYVVGAVNTNEDVPAILLIPYFFFNSTLTFVNFLKMDITALFKTTVKAMKAHLKNTGVDVNDNDILKPRFRCAYIVKYRDLVHQITQLKDFLMDNRKAYMNLSPDNFTNAGDMTDFDRDKVDSEAQFIIKTCSQLISTYKKEAYLIEQESQELENRKAILDLIESYLKSVCKIYTEQKAIRVKLTVEVQKMAKLTKDTSLSNEPHLDKDTSNIDKKENDVSEKQNNKSGLIRYSTFAAANEIEETALSEEELQMFEMENQHLYNELNSLNDEVRDIQSKVIKIAELQEVFTEKVLEQNDEIERISTTLVGTTENLKDANVQIRQAIQSNASLRIYILFFLLIMSFSLLFLDWYND